MVSRSSPVIVIAGKAGGAISERSRYPEGELYVRLFMDQTMVRERLSLRGR
jgi:hypothetical protein